MIDSHGERITESLILMMDLKMLVTVVTAFPAYVPTAPVVILSRPNPTWSAWAGVRSSKIT